jgi:probable HAF family extracellular repeat protein
LPLLQGFAVGCVADINDAGESAGWLYNGGFRATLWKDGAVIDLGVLPGGTYASSAAIGDGGNVVGTANVPGDERVHGFLYRKGRLTDLGSFGGRTNAWDTEKGVVVGGSATGIRKKSHAFSWRRRVMTDLGALGGKSSEAFGINKSGQIVGSASSPNGTHAFLYQNGQMSDLGTLGGPTSRAIAINDRGDIVGYSKTGQSYPDDIHAFLYEAESMTDLNSTPGIPTGWILRAADSINDSGQILVEAIPVSGTYEVRTFLLTPR